MRLDSGFRDFQSCKPQASTLALRVQLDVETGEFPVPKAFYITDETRIFRPLCCTMIGFVSYQGDYKSEIQNRSLSAGLVEGRRNKYLPQTLFLEYCKGVFVLLFAQTAPRSSKLNSMSGHPLTLLDEYSALQQQKSFLAHPSLL